MPLQIHQVGAGVFSPPAQEDRPFLATVDEVQASFETPFISFLLLDEAGLIIRERRYPTMDNWPGADQIRSRLGLRGG